MHPIDDKNVCEELSIDNDSGFLNFKENGKYGIEVVNEPYREIEEKVAQPDSGDFVKWLHINRPDITVSIQKSVKRLVLHSNDYWLPLVYLASDVTLQIYLNLVANYLYDKSKGLFKGETARVHMSAIYEDSESGITKRFNFEGDTVSLQKAIKKFDLNNFMK